VTTVLDWSDREHWSSIRLPCIHCKGATNLRDDDNRPSHKVCAEQEAAS
jgi:hypothetical protein